MSHRLLFRTLAVLALVCLMVGCHNRRPSAVLSPEQMEAILYDYQISLAIANTQSDSAYYRAHLYSEAVLNKHGVTRATFDSSLVWYAAHTDQLYAIFQNLEQRYDQAATALGMSAGDVRTARYSDEGDTANIWRGASHYLLSSKALTHRMTFTIDADTAFWPKDRYEWHFNTHFVSKSGPRSAFIGLILQYDNDSTVQTCMEARMDDDFCLTLNADDEQPLKCIKGFVYLNAPWEEAEKLLLISKPVLLRYHTERPEPKAPALPADTLAADSLVADTARVDSLE